MHRSKFEDFKGMTASPRPFLAKEEGSAQGRKMREEEHAEGQRTAE